MYPIIRKLALVLVFLCTSDHPTFAQYVDVPQAIPFEGVTTLSTHLGQANVCADGNRALVTWSDYRFVWARVFDETGSPLTPAAVQVAQDARAAGRIKLFCTALVDSFEILFETSTYGLAVASVDRESGRVREAQRIIADPYARSVYAFDRLGDDWFILVGNDTPRGNQRLTAIFIDRESTAKRIIELSTEDYSPRATASRVGDHILVAHASGRSPRTLKLAKVAADTSLVEAEIGTLGVEDVMAMAAGSAGRALLAIARRNGSLDLLLIRGTEVLRTITLPVLTAYAPPEIGATWIGERFLVAVAEKLVVIEGENVNVISSDSVAGSVTTFDGGFLTLDSGGWRAFLRPSLGASSHELPVKRQFTGQRSPAIAVNAETIALAWTEGSARLQLFDRAGMPRTAPARLDAWRAQVVPRDGTFFVLTETGGGLRGQRIASDGAWIDAQPRTIFESGMDAPVAVSSDDGFLVAWPTLPRRQDWLDLPQIRIAALDEQGSTRRLATFPATPTTFMRSAYVSQTLIRGEGANLLAWLASPDECRVNECIDPDPELHALLFTDDLREIARYEFGAKLLRLARWNGHQFQMVINDTLISLAEDGGRADTPVPFAWPAVRLTTSNETTNEFAAYLRDRPARTRFDVHQGVYDAEPIGPEVTSLAPAFDAEGRLVLAYTALDPAFTTHPVARLYLRAALPPRSFHDLSIEGGITGHLLHEVRHRYVVANRGSTAARSAVVRFSHPSGGRVVASGELVCHGSADVSTCTIPLLGPGAEETIELVVRRRNQWRPARVEGVIDGEGFDMNDSNNRVVSELERSRGVRR